MKILGIIPARLASTRYPEKALVDIFGKPMVVRTYEQASKASCLDRVVVATDHPKIEKVLHENGCEVVMTGDHHRSGTDRCREVIEKLDEEFDYVINIQGDEPFIKPVQIEECATMLDGNTQLATMVSAIDNPEEVFNPNTVKVVFGVDGHALYFSRHPVPFIRDDVQDNWFEIHTFYKHVSIYAYRSDILKEITNLEAGRLEKAESLEQLRWLENGYQIKVGVTKHKNLGIDTSEDLAKALKVYKDFF